MTIVSCGRTDQVAIDAHAQLVQDAVALIEKDNPIHQDDPSVLAFRKKYPAVLGMTTDDGSNQRLSIINDGANKEHIDERYDPPHGEIYFPDGSSKRFMEFRVKCRLNGRALNLKIKVEDKRNEKTS